MAKKQPNWQFTAARQNNLKKARKVIAQIRKEAGISIVKTALDRSRLEAAIARHGKKKGKKG